MPIIHVMRTFKDSVYVRPKCCDKYLCEFTRLHHVRQVYICSQCKQQYARVNWFVNENKGIVFSLVPFKPLPKPPSPRNEQIPKIKWWPLRVHVAIVITINLVLWGIAHAL